MTASNVTRPICFVLMPTGRGIAGGHPVDFDRVYRDLIAPAVIDAGLQPLRPEAADAESVNTPWLGQLLLAECAVVDLTSADAAVYFALGLRNGVRQASTVLVSAEGGADAPFGLASRAVRYSPGPDSAPGAATAVQAVIADRLRDALRAGNSAGWLNLLDGGTDIQRLKTDIFRDHAPVPPAIARRLAQARREGADAVRAVEAELGDIAEAESAAVIDLMLSYRAVKAWDAVIALVERMSPPLARTAMAREQLAFALNRAGRSDEAERVLTALIDERGPSSETNSLLGRVYKDRWEKAAGDGDTGAAALLDRAIATYLAGFEADWRDAFPGINVVTLMELRDPPDPRRHWVVPLVRFAVERRIALGAPDYWDYATLIELSVIEKDEAGAADALAHALSLVRERWEPESTARNLSMIRRARERRRETVPWAAEIENALSRSAQTS